jgi:hypothetical protein
MSGHVLSCAVRKQKAYCHPSMSCLRFSTGIQRPPGSAIFTDTYWARLRTEMVKYPLYLARYDRGK